jgi:hypothetical protein
LLFNFVEVNINFLEFNKMKVYIQIVKDSRPTWLEALDEEDLRFLKRFVLGSGSLKALCDDYQVSYPTLRARLDRLIAKVQAAEDPKIADAFQLKLQVLVADGKLSPPLARELLKAHRAAAEEGTK